MVGWGEDAQVTLKRLRFDGAPARPYSLATSRRKKMSPAASNAGTA